MSVSIIIVNWNSKDFVRDCIASIVTTTAGVDYEIIVIDSASFDGCDEMLSELYPKVTFVQCDRNIGFGKANNLGVEHAQGEILLLLNPDTIVTSRAIKDLHDNFMSLTRPGVIGCRLLNRDGSLQLSCVQPFPTIANQLLNVEILQRFFPKSRLWASAASFRDDRSPVKVEVVSGACMMMKRHLFDRVEGFSQDYFMYGEDLDLCYKVHRLGYANYHVPDIEIFHFGGGSTDETHSRFSTVMVRESVSIFLNKVYGETYPRFYKIGLGVSSCVRLIVLALYFPLAVVRGRESEWMSSLRKWTTVFRWSVGLEGWAKELYQCKEIS